MTRDRLQELLDKSPDKLDWTGKCHDCRQPVHVTATPKEDGIHIDGGAVFEPQEDRFYLKCDACFKKKPVLTHYQKCEVYARVVGYYRPVDQWNDGKQAEYKDRVMFDRQALEDDSNDDIGLLLHEQ